MQTYPIVLNFVTRTARDEAMQALQGLCREHDILIFDHKMYSNLSLVLVVEGTVGGCLSFCEALARNSFRMDDSSQGRLEELKRAPVDSQVQGTIQVTFASEDGSLIIPVPYVPG